MRPTGQGTHEEQSQDLKPGLSDSKGCALNPDASSSMTTLQLETQRCIPHAVFQLMKALTDLALHEAV